MLFISCSAVTPTCTTQVLSDYLSKPARIPGLKSSNSCRASPAVVYESNPSLARLQKPRILVYTDARTIDAQRPRMPSPFLDAPAPNNHHAREPSDVQRVVPATTSWPNSAFLRGSIRARVRRSCRRSGRAWRTRSVRWGNDGVEWMPGSLASLLGSIGGTGAVPLADGFGDSALAWRRWLCLAAHRVSDAGLLDRPEDALRNPRPIACQPRPKSALDALKHEI